MILWTLCFQATLKSLRYNSLFDLVYDMILSIDTIDHIHYGVLVNLSVEPSMTVKFEQRMVLNNSNIDSTEEWSKQEFPIKYQVKSIEISESRVSKYTHYEIWLLSRE